MERVKPHYLSKTYDLPLPEDRPSWKPEEFLDKLARMKGRLRKGGEPDLDSVAKIVLSDWVRGRIPYFVSPPERSEELNQAEAKATKVQEIKSGSKDKGKAKETEERTLGVKQHIGSIMQKNSFLPEDIRRFEEEEDVEEAGASGGESSEDEEEEEDADAQDAEPELSWNDLFAGEQKEEASAAPVPRPRAGVFH